MKNSRCPRFLPILIPILLSAITPHLCAQAYQITDLGTLPGQTGSAAVGINQSGQIAGYSGSRSFIYSNGVMTDLGNIDGAIQTSATAINNKGQIVGIYVPTSPQGRQYGFLWDNGVISDPFNSAAYLQTQTYATKFQPTALNDNGQVTINIGSDQMPNVDSALFWQLPGNQSTAISAGDAYAINNVPQVALVEKPDYSFGVIWSPDGTTTSIPNIDNAFGGYGPTPHGINNSGQAAGEAVTNSGNNAFLFADGNISDLGTLGGANSTARAINSTGQIVGDSDQNPNTALTQNRHAFLYANGSMLDLNSQVANITGWELTSAVGINDAGQIVGNGSYLGSPHGFLLIPITQVTITPIEGGNAGNVTLDVFFPGTTPASVDLRCGNEKTIAGSIPIMIGPGLVRVTFNLIGVQPGTCDVVLIEPNGASVSVVDGFVVQAGGAPDILTSLIGRNVLRAGQAQTYFLNVINRGNIDSGSASGGISFPIFISGKNSDNFQPIWSLATDANSTLAFNIGPIQPQGSIAIPVTLTAPDAPQFAHQPFDLRSDFRLDGSSAPVVPAASKVGAFSPKTPINLASALATTASNPQRCVYWPGTGQISGPTNETISGSLGQGVWITLFLTQPMPAHVIVTTNYGDYRVIDLAPGVKITLNFGVFGNEPLPWSISFQTDNDIYEQIETDYCPCIGPECLAGSVITSGDPNDKVGTPGIGTGHYVSTTQPLLYSIYFDNLPTADAPAQKVNVLDQLDPTLIDPSTVSIGPISFNGRVIAPFEAPITTGTSFNTEIDLRPDEDIILKIGAVFNPTTALSTWTFTSLDPITNQPTTDPTSGFLPPGAEGSVAFTVRPKASPTGTEITNHATVIFDKNPEIDTPTWLNTIDSTPPKSHVTVLSTTQFVQDFTVGWSGADVGAGVQDYTIYVSDNGAPFTPWLINTTTISAIYAGQFGHSYAFYSIARDLVGNVEAAKSAADASTSVAVDTTPPVITPTISGSQGQSGWYRSAVTIAWSVADPESGIASSNGCAETTLSKDVAGVTLTCSATNGAGLSNSASIRIKIDQTPPVISGMPKPGCDIWPPNDRLIRVATVSAKDALSGLASFNLTGISNEPHDPSDADDIRIEGRSLQSRTVYLRADTLGRRRDDGWDNRYEGDDKDKRRHKPREPKVYTLTATATDSAGNTTTSTATCEVKNPRER